MPIDTTSEILYKNLMKPETSDQIRAAPQRIWGF